MAPAPVALLLKGVRFFSAASFSVVLLFGGRGVLPRGVACCIRVIPLMDSCGRKKQERRTRERKEKGKTTATASLACSSSSKSQTVSITGYMFCLANCEIGKK